MAHISSDNRLNSLAKAAEEIARAGGDSTLDYFKKSFDLEFKSDQTPVTNADRNAEETIREAIMSRFPDHGIIGEEYGTDGGDKEVVWVVDPIDGTQSFIHGVPFYTTLIGVLVEGEPKVGVIYAPALDEMAVGVVGAGARLNGKPCRARSCNDLASATFLTTDIENIEAHGYRESWDSLRAKARLHRTWGDAYGHLMVAAGRADIMFDPIVSIWDAAALLPVVTESGAAYSDVTGEETIHSGSALSCSSGVQQSVLNLLKPTK